jgi:hypothetical protein
VALDALLGRDVRVHVQRDRLAEAIRTGVVPAAAARALAGQLRAAEGEARIVGVLDRRLDAGVVPDTADVQAVLVEPAHPVQLR